MKRSMKAESSWVWPHLPLASPCRRHRRALLSRALRRVAPRRRSRQLRTGNAAAPAPGRTRLCRARNHLCQLLELPIRIRVPPIHDVPDEVHRVLQTPPARRGRRPGGAKTRLARMTATPRHTPGAGRRAGRAGADGRRAEGRRAKVQLGRAGFFGRVRNGLRRRRRRRVVLVGLATTSAHHQALAAAMRHSRR